MATETWTWRDYPIFEAAVNAEADIRDITEAIAQDVDLPEPDRIRGIAALVKDGFLTGIDVTSYAESGRVYIGVE
jgi:hypothetical protein